jgi:hypothetical protein
MLIEKLLEWYLERLCRCLRRTEERMRRRSATMRRYNCGSALTAGALSIVATIALICPLQLPEIQLQRDRAISSRFVHRTIEAKTGVFSRRRPGSGLHAIAVPRFSREGSPFLGFTAGPSLQRAFFAMIDPTRPQSKGFWPRSTHP